MSPIRALADGIQRVHRAPAIIVGVWLTAALFVLPFALTLTANPEGTSARLVVTVTRGFVDPWLRALNAVTATPALERGRLLRIAVGSPVTFLNRESAATAGLLSSTLFGILWLFLAGGIIDRYARDRATRSRGFFQACGVFALRLLRVVPLLLVGEMLVSRYLSQAVAANVALAGVGLLADYTAVRLVVEDRRSVFGALRAASSFVGRNLGAVLTLYLIQYAMLAALVGIYSAASPTALVNELYAIGRIWIRLVEWSAATALFQSRLAHAGYVAQREAVWPEAPTVEAVMTTRSPT